MVAALSLNIVVDVPGGNCPTGTRRRRTCAATETAARLSHSRCFDSISTSVGFTLTNCSLRVTCEVDVDVLTCSISAVAVVENEYRRCSDMDWLGYGCCRSGGSMASALLVDESNSAGLMRAKASRDWSAGNHSSPTASHSPSWPSYSAAISSAACVINTGETNSSPRLDPISPAPSDFTQLALSRFVARSQNKRSWEDEKAINSTRAWSP